MVFFMSKNTRAKKATPKKTNPNRPFKMTRKREARIDDAMEWGTYAHIKTHVDIARNEKTVADFNDQLEQAASWAEALAQDLRDAKVKR